VNWARTVRFDGAIDDAQRRKISASLPAGASLKFGAAHAAAKRTYGLVQGPASLEPSEVEPAFSNARWYDEPIIALAIEPTPADALPAIENALAGAGGASGILDCTAVAGLVVVEFQPARTVPSLILNLVDVELRRFHGYRKVTLLNPLPAEVTAQIAAAGLQASEIAPDRILETLLEQSSVE
jgi:hypothetical protein